MTSSSPAFLAAVTEEELKSVLCKVADGYQEEARFGGDAKQRGMAHRAARGLGLLAASEGDGESRHVRVWRRPPVAAAEPADGRQDADEESCQEEEGWDEEEDEPLQPFDLYRALGLQRGFGGGDARVRSSYHRLALAARQQLGDCEECEDKEAEAEAWLRFRRITVAAGVLLDKGRKEVYERLGFAGLQESEKYYELSVFDDDPHDRLERFFNGCDEDDREYLLLNGAGPPSDDEGAGAEDEEGSEGGSAADSDEEVLAEALRAPRHTRLHMDSDCEEGLPAPPPGVVLGAAGLGPSVKHKPHDPFAALAAKLGAAASAPAERSDQKASITSTAAGKSEGKKGGKPSRKKQKT